VQSGLEVLGGWAFRLANVMKLTLDLQWKFLLSSGERADRKDCAWFVAQCKSSYPRQMKVLGLAILEAEDL
jgi:hypothetical protein